MGTRLRFYKTPGFWVILGALYILIYSICLADPRLNPIAWLMVFFFPFLLVISATVIFKNGKYTGPALDGEEFGYQDRRREDLGVF